MSGFKPLPSKPSDHKSSHKPADEKSVQSLMPRFTWFKSKTKPLASKPSDHKSAHKPADEKNVQSLMPQFTWVKSKTNSSTYHTVFDTAKNAHTFKSKLLQLIQQCGLPLDAVVDRTIKGAYVVSILGITESVLSSLAKNNQAQFKTLSSEAVVLTKDEIEKLITELDKKHLKRCKKILGTITDLTISYNEITSVGIETLSLALKENTTLTSLDLYNIRIAPQGATKIGPRGAKCLANALKKNTTLTSLSLGYNRINRGAKDLADALAENTTLTLLDLGHSHIGAQDATDLANALIKNTALTSLYLGANYIGDIGATSLAIALLENTTLTSLDLGHNEIGQQGVTFLANALEINTTLTSLNLGGNEVGIQGAKDLAHALQENTTLTSLDLWWSTKLYDAGINALVDVLNENAVLTSLKLEGNETTKTLVTQFLTRNQAFHPKFGLLQRHLADKLSEFISMSTDLTNIIVAYRGGFNVAMVLSLMLSLRRQLLLQEVSAKMSTDVANIVVDYAVEDANLKEEINLNILLSSLDVTQELSIVPHVEIEVLSDKEDAKSSKYDHKHDSFAMAQRFHKRPKPTASSLSEHISGLSLESCTLQ